MVRPYRLSDEERRARAERMRRLHADPQFLSALRAGVRRAWNDPKLGAALRERMKRRSANHPELAVVSSERMKRRHKDDPEFVAALRAGARRIWADPEFLAKRTATCHLPAAKRDAIISALTANPNATKVAQQLGVCVKTVYTLARITGIALPKGRGPR